MKVAYIISMVKGGVPAFTYREIDILSSNGFDIALFPLTYKKGPYMPRDGWPVYRLRLRDLVAAFTRAKLATPRKYIRLLAVALKTGCFREFVLGTVYARQMRAWGVQHIHCHFGDSKLYTGYFCAEWLGLPLSCTLHAYEIHSNPKPDMFRIASARCSHIVVQSEFNKDLAIRNLGVQSDHIQLIRAHGDMHDETESLKILIVGEFREKKGHRVLFEALKKLNRPDLTLWVVGEGSLDVQAMAEELGIASRVKFFGTLGENLLNVLYDACDIYVQPSLTARDGDSEGIPASLMEAMSHARPVISTRHAGIPELVEELIVEPGSVEELAAAIEKLAENPELRRELGARNKEIVKQRFSTEAVLELGEVFRSSANANPTRLEE